MMVLSRIWYVVVSLVLGVALYVAYLAVGEYNRRNALAMNEELASDSQVVGWAMQIDARHRLDALLLGSVDPAVQGALGAAEDKDKIPAKAKDDARKALLAVNEKIPVEYRSDALFAIDHDGRVVGQIGFDQAGALEDFELGGYPAVFDAMHGYLRDDTWVLGGKIYRVVARPVEFDVTQRPLGAIVGLRAVDAKFAQDLSKRTRANIAFFAGGQRVVSAATEGFDANLLEQINTELPALAQDKSYMEGRSEAQMLGEGANALGVIYARLPGDAWDLGGGFAVARPRIVITGPMGFLNGADDKDKQAVDWGIIALAIALSIVGGIGLSILEQTLPMREMQSQAARLKKGEFDYFQLPRIRGSYRAIAQDINSGIERVLEKGGGAVRKPADLESILGPVPAQPSMSAFSFPMADGSSPGSAPRPGSQPPPPPFGAPPPVRPAPQGPVALGPSRPGLSPPGLAFPQGSSPQPPQSLPQSAPLQAAALQASFSAVVPPAPPAPTALAQPATAQPFKNMPAPAGVVAPPPRMQGDSSGDADDGETLALAHAPLQGLAQGGPPKGPIRPAAPTMAGIGQGGTSPNPPGAGLQRPMTPPPIGLGAAQSAVQAANAMPTPNAFFPPARGKPASRPQIPNAPVASAQTPAAPAAGGPAREAAPPPNDEEPEEATVVAPAPSELLAAASENKATGEAAEWLAVYDDFVRTKKKCGEATEGLTFEKFQHTLKKNRDALLQRHGCKRVRFSVYVKEGRASLKATPVRD